MITRSQIIQCIPFLATKTGLSFESIWSLDEGKIAAMIAGEVAKLAGQTPPASLTLAEQCAWPVLLDLIEKLGENANGTAS